MSDMAIPEPFCSIVRVVGEQHPAGYRWAAYNDNGELLLYLDKDGLAELVNTPERTWSVRIEHENERATVLFPNTLLSIKWDTLTNRKGLRDPEINHPRTT